MADRAVRPTRLKTSHQPTVQQNKPIRDVFRGHPRSPVGWRDHITEYRLLSTRRPHLAFTYTVGAFGWATVRPSTDSNLLL
nr:MAG TPA: hypothetical protein [Caudoviricetes sp.]